MQFFRLDQPFVFGLSQAQFLSFAVGAVAVWILVFQWTQASRDNIDDDLDDDPEDDEKPVAPANVQATGSGSASSG